MNTVIYLHPEQIKTDFTKLTLSLNQTFAFVKATHNHTACHHYIYSLVLFTDKDLFIYCTTDTVSICHRCFATAASIVLHRPQLLSLLQRLTIITV